MPRIGSVEYNYLSEYIDTGRKTSEDMTDMRNFDWSQGAKQRYKYMGDHHFKIDFSHSKAETGFILRKAVFEECVFDHSKWWLAQFYNCKFVHCRFDYCLLYNSGLGGKFYNCSFKHLITRGEFFSFGWDSIYANCVFESLDVRNINESIGIKFQDCKIDGTIKNTFISTFHGRKYALRKRFEDLPSVFSSLYCPVKFIRCDLTNLKTKNVVFEKDIVYKDTKGRPISIND